MNLHFDVPADTQTKNYFDTLMSKILIKYAIAEKARATGFDVHTQVECLPATDIADRTEKISGPKGVAARFRTILLEQKGDRMKAIFVLFKEIVMQEGEWYAEENMEKRVEQAVKTCLVIMTEGVVVAPLDGIPYVKISTNPDGTK